MEDLGMVDESFLLLLQEIYHYNHKLKAREDFLKNPTTEIASGIKKKRSKLTSTFYHQNACWMHLPSLEKKPQKVDVYAGATCGFSRLFHLSLVFAASKICAVARCTPRNWFVGI